MENICKNCGAKVADNVNFCGECGKEIFRCKECGNILNEKEEPCSACGYMPKKENNVSQKDKKKFNELTAEYEKKLKNYKLINTVISIITGIVLALFVFIKIVLLKSSLSVEFVFIVASLYCFVENVCGAVLVKFPWLIAGSSLFEYMKMHNIEYKDYIKFNIKSKEFLDTDFENNFMGAKSTVGSLMLLAHLEKDNSKFQMIEIMQILFRILILPIAIAMVSPILMGVLNMIHKIGPFGINTYEITLCVIGLIIIVAYLITSSYCDKYRQKEMTKIYDEIINAK